MRLRHCLLALIVVTAACGRQDDFEGTTYRHSEDGSPTSIDPLQSATVYSNQITVNVYDTLYRYKYLARPYELAPNLAEAMPEVSDDGLTYTIQLKKGVRFIDDPAFPDGKGREVKAQDVVFSLKRHFDPANISQGRWLWEGRVAGLAEWGEAGADYEAEVPGLRALDDHTLQIRLTRPYPQLLYTLTMGFSGVVPPEAIERYGRDLGTRAVGSGPWQLTHFSRGQVRFVPNPNFRREPLDLAYEGYDEDLHGHLGIEHLDGESPPFVDRLMIDFVEEASARWASFTSGREIHYTWIPVEQIDRVLAAKDPVQLRPDYARRYHYHSEPESGFVFTKFNMADAAIGLHDDPEQDARNRELRCAMRDAFNWTQRNDRIYSGMGIVFPGVIPPVLAEFDRELSHDSVTHSPERARERLQRAGWTPDNLPMLEYGTVSSALNREMYEEFRGYLTAIGIPSDRIRVRSFATFGDYNRAMRNAELQILPYGWGLDYPDAQNTLQLFYGPNASPGSNNANYRNPEYDRLYEKASILPPGAERTAIYRQMNRMVIDDCVGIFGLTRQRVHLWHKDVLGLPDRGILGGFWLRFVDIAE